MASSEELFDAIKEELEKNGMMNTIHAEIRSALIDLLNLKSKGCQVKPPRDTVLICELIREFLQFHQYNYTSLIFTSESGLPQTAMSRPSLIVETGIQETENSKKLPLLYGLLSTYRKAEENENVP